MLRVNFPQKQTTAPGPQAVRLALAAYTCWVLADTAMKFAGRSSLPALQIIALIGLAEVGILLAYSAWLGRVRTLWPKKPVRQLLRSCLDFANNFGVIVALRHLPLALFYILIFLAPMVTALSAALFLNEALSWKKALGIFAGFIGVVVAVNPFGMLQPGDRAGYIACAVCVVCFSANIVWSRRLTQTEASESMTFTSGLVAAAAGGIATMLRAEPVSLRLAAVLLVTGAFCVVGSLCFFRALRHTAAANVSQYHYSQLITGALVAYLLWGERPTTSMIAGAILIVASGLYLAGVSATAVRKKPSRGDASALEGTP